VCLCVGYQTVSVSYEERVKTTARGSEEMPNFSGSLRYDGKRGRERTAGNASRLHAMDSRRFSPPLSPLISIPPGITPPHAVRAQLQRRVEAQHLVRRHARQEQVVLHTREGVELSELSEPVTR
jgi:hypothetical protein